MLINFAYKIQETEDKLPDERWKQTTVNVLWWLSINRRLTSTNNSSLAPGQTTIITLDQQKAKLTTIYMYICSSLLFAIRDQVYNGMSEVIQPKCIIIYINMEIVMALQFSFSDSVLLSNTKFTTDCINMQHVFYVWVHLVSLRHCKSRKKAKLHNYGNKHICSLMFRWWAIQLFLAYANSEHSLLALLQHWYCLIHSLQCSSASAFGYQVWFTAIWGVKYFYNGYLILNYSVYNNQTRFVSENRSV